MATKKKVARSRTKAAQALGVIEYSQEEGETVARVRERSSGCFLATAIGSKPFARRVARVFLLAWSAEHERVSRAIDAHGRETEQLKRRAIARASEAAAAVVGAS
jgi:hypothetical protein